jgi:uncharacterized protein YdhG (YjbR/CyaY superfamily)
VPEHLIEGDTVTDAKDEPSDGFTEAERAAIKERAKELKAAARRDAKRADLEKDVLMTIAELPELERAIAERIHAIVSENAPHLVAKLRYGMPTYTTDDNKVVCFFQSASKWDTRFSTLAFEDAGTLDDGDIWPTAFGILELTPTVEKKVTELVKKAVG